MIPIWKDPVWVDRSISFFLGVVSSLVASWIWLFIDSGKSVLKIRRILVQSLVSRRLRKIQIKDDPHAVIRTEWAIALRDIGSKKPADVLRALQTLYHMADILEPDEKEVAHEALRLRIALNTIRDTDKDYLRTMSRLIP